MRVAIGGPIGAGKTTLCLKALNELGGRIAIEPNEANPFLALSYEDPERWSFHAQVDFIASRSEACLKDEELGDCDILYDRTIFEDRVFATTKYRMGHFSGAEYATYLKIFARLTHGITVPDVYVNLQCPPRVCSKRIMARARSDESAIPMDYLETLDSVLNDFFVEMAEKTLVVNLDATQPPQRVFEDLMDFLSSLPSQ